MNGDKAVCGLHVVEQVCRKRKHFLSFNNTGEIFFLYIDHQMNAECSRNSKVALTNWPAVDTR